MAKIGAGHASAMGRLGLTELRNAANPSKESVADKEIGLYGTQTQGEISSARGGPGGEQEGSVHGDKEAGKETGKLTLASFRDSGKEQEQGKEQGKELAKEQEKPKEKEHEMER